MSTIWTKAKEMELEAVSYYRKLAGEAIAIEIAGAFTMIATEESRHAEMFAKLEADSHIGQFTAVSWDPKALFENLAKTTALSSQLLKAKDVYKKVIALELENANYYENLLSNLREDSDRKAVEFIIKEEKKHAKIFENLLQFIEQPETWVENAEFGVMGDF